MIWDFKFGLLYSLASTHITSIELRNLEEVKPIFKTQYQYIYIQSLLCVGKNDYLICILRGALEPPQGQDIFRPIFY